MRIKTNDIPQTENYLIIGLGLTGLSCVRFLMQRDINVSIMDTREFPPFLSALQRDYPEVIIKTGGVLEVVGGPGADLVWHGGSPVVALA